MNITVSKLVSALKPYFITSSGNNVVGGNISPDVSGLRDLGTRERPFRRVYALELIGSSVILDDQTEYVHVSNARTITARHTFSPSSALSPFILGANAQGQVVTGLMADQLNKSVLAGNGMTGGGALSSSVTLTLGAPSSLTSSTTNSVSGTTHTHAIDSTIARSAITITAGAGLTGGGDLTANRTLDVGAGTMITVNANDVAITAGATYQFIGTGSGTAAGWRNVSELAGSGLTAANGVLAVGAGSGITVNADDVALTTPGTLTVSTTNNSSGSHVHAITTSLGLSVGASSVILSTNASGYVQVTRLGVGATPLTSIDTSGDIQIGGMGHFKGWNAGGATGAGMDIGVSGGVGTLLSYDRTGSAYIPMRIAANASNQLYLATDGNIGFSIATIEPWSATYGALQLGTHSSVMYHKTSNGLYLMNNAYYDGAWKYENNGAAFAIVLNSSGGAEFRVAASGTANDSFSWTNAVLFLNSGYVGIGVTPTTNFHVAGSGKFTGSVDADVQFLGQAADTVSAPSFSWTGDTNVGMYRPATDTIGFTTAGVERMRITSTGKVGIGVTPSVGMLDITQAAATPGIIINRVTGQASIKAGASDGYIMLDSTGQAAAINYYVADNIFLAYGGGNVAIGNNNPSHKLHVSGDIRATGDIYVDGGMVDFGTNYFNEATDFELQGAKAFSLFQTIKAASWNITTAGTGTFVDVVTPSVRATTGVSLTVSAGTDVILDPVSNLVKTASGVSMQSSAYASQTTGWRVTDAGEADFRYLFVDEMHAKSFIADLEQALAGGQIISKSVAVLYSNFTAPAAGATAQLVVRDLPSATGMAAFVNGDFVRIRNFNRSGGSLTIGDCWGTVVLDTTYGVSGFDSATKTQRYTFTRSSGADAGAMTAGTVVNADSIILDYGTAGNGFYEVNAIDGAYALNSPYAQIVTWATHPRTQVVRSRLGNLRGIFSVANEYGLYAGDGTGVTNRFLRASSEAIEFRNVPISLYDGSNITMSLSAGSSNNSPVLSMGYPIPTGPLVENGLWMGKDGADYEFRVGTVSGGVLTKGLHWNGSTLNIIGNTIIGPGSGFVTTASAHMKFDAPTSNMYRVNLNTHLGQYPVSITGSYRGDFGKFSGGLQLRPAGKNYVSNPSFEVNTTDYWTAYNNATVTRVGGGLFGTYALSMVTGAGTNPYIYRTGAPDTLATGQVWAFSAYVKAANANGVGKTVTLNLRENADGAYLSSSSVVLTREWQRVAVVRTLTHATPTSLNNYIVFTSAASSGDGLLIDGVQLEKDFLSGYIDGTMDNVTWDGTAHNSASTQTDVSVVSYSKSIIPENTAEGTVMMWVKPIAATGDTMTFLQYTGSSGYVIIRITSGTDWQGYYGSQVVTVGGGVIMGQWQHIAVTRTGGSTKLYINGAYGNNGAGTDLTFHSSNNVGFGYATDAANGVIDEVTFIDRALSADEIKQIYQSGAPLIVPTTNNELSVSNGGLSAVRINSNGISAISETGIESFALANGTMNWGTRYTSGQAGQLGSGDLVLGDPDEFHLMYDASAASVLLGKATEEHIQFSSSGIEFKNSTNVWAKIDANTFTFGKTTEQYIAVSTGGLFFQNGATTLGGISTLGVLTLGEYANDKSRMEANSGQLKFINRVGGVDTEYVNLSTAGTLTLGKTTAEHMVLSGTALEFKNSTTVLGSFDGTTLTLGQTGGTNNNIVITPTSLEIRYGSTPKISLDSSGNASFTGAITASSGSITGNLSIGSAGTLYSGAAATWQSAGYQLQYNAGTTPRMYIGDGGVTTGDKYLMWDGTNLSFRGTNTSLTTAGRFTASDVDVTGIVTADSGSIGGWALASVSLTGGNVYLHNSGYIRVGAASADRLWLSAVDATYRLWIGNDTPASAAFRVSKTGGLTATGVNLQFPDSPSENTVYLQLGSLASISRRQWASSNETLELMSTGGRSSVAIMTRNTGQPNGYNAAVIVEQNNYVSTITLSATNILNLNGNKVWHADNDGSASGLDADLLDGSHASAFSLTSHNHDASYSAIGHTHAGVYAPVSHTHAYGDITGNGNISTTGTLTTGAATIASNADSLITLGRVKVGGSAISDAAMFSHFDFHTTTGYALSQNASGYTFVNAASGQGVQIRSNDTMVARFESSYVEIPSKLQLENWVRIKELTTAPGTSDLTSLTHAAVFVKNDRLYLAYNNAGSMRYYYLTLTQTATVDTLVNWMYGGSTAP